MPQKKLQRQQKHLQKAQAQRPVDETRVSTIVETRSNLNLESRLGCFIQVCCSKLL